MSSGSWIESPPPSSATRRTRRRSFAPAVVEVAGLLDIKLLGWQRAVLDVALEHKGGRLAYREVNLSTPRQVGKSTLTLLVALHRMLASPGSWVTYTTASRLAGRRKMLRTWWPLIARSPLRDRFRPTKGTGSESLECSNCRPTDDPLGVEEHPEAGGGQVQRREAVLDRTAHRRVDPGQQLGNRWITDQRDGIRVPGRRLRSTCPCVLVEPGLHTMSPTDQITPFGVVDRRHRLPTSHTSECARASLESPRPPAT
jgi:hypothetical protein